MENYYIAPISELLSGDILLMRFHDENSLTVMEKTNSTFSHATIYLGDTSYAEATRDRGVIANNLQRQLFPNEDDFVVLRLKSEYYTPTLIDKTIYRVRELIGTAYGVLEAVRIAEIEHRPDNGKPISPNRQTCTRLVAQAFHDSGLDIVYNYAYCSPEEILRSNKFVQLPLKLIPATEKDIAFANSENPILDFVDAQYLFLLNARKVTKEDLQTPQQITDFVYSHPEFDKAVSEVLKDSNYLEIYKLEEKLNPWHYDTDEFKKKYEGEEVDAAYELQRTSKHLMNLYKQNLIGICERYDETQMTYFGLIKDLYEHLVEQCQRRIDVAENIVTDFDIIFK